MCKRIVETSHKQTKRFKLSASVSLFILICLFMPLLRRDMPLVNNRRIQEDILANYIDDEGVCMNALPFAKMHHKNLNEIKNYQMVHTNKAKCAWDDHEFKEKDPPELRTLPPGSSFSQWDCTYNNNDCPISITHTNIKGSAWTADGEDAFVDNIRDDYPRTIWVAHEKYDFLATKRTTIKGDAAAMIGFFPTNFGHVLHDNFPLLAWLKSSVPDHTTFILPDTKRYRRLIDFIDPHFSERIYFYHKNEVITVEEGTLTVAKPVDRFVACYGNTLFRYMRHWIFDSHQETYPDEEKYLIFHTRGGPHTEHGRVLDPQHEQDVLAIIKSNMEKYNRKEKLVFFTGMDEEGNILSYEEQFDIFRHASTIIGPHGSGLANVVWTHPFPKSCNDRVHMLEFIAGTDTPTVQSPSFNGYYWVLRGMPIDWHQITYASNSTVQKTYLRLDDLQRALDDMWGEKQLSW